MHLAMQAKLASEMMPFCIIPTTAAFSEENGAKKAVKWPSWKKPSTL
jgi:hypothetical protein